jgi:hypothetical protein
MASPRESGPAYEVQALRLMVQLGYITDSAIAARIGTLAQDLVTAMTQALHFWELPLIARRAEQLGDDVKQLTGINPLDVDDGQTPPLPLDLFQQATSSGGELAAGGTYGGASQQAANAAGAAVGSFVGKIGSTAMLLIYAVIAIALLIGGAYAVKVARK